MDYSERFIIEDGVLKRYVGNTKIVIPEGVREIGERAFFSDHSVVSVTLPEGLERIGKNAFCMCGRLTSINIPKSVKEIGTAAFDSCFELSTITQPAEDAILGDDSFLDVPGLSARTVFRLSETYCTDISVLMRTWSSPLA